jgi:hypothetical protein
VHLATTKCNFTDEEKWVQMKKQQHIYDAYTKLQTLLHFGARGKGELALFRFQNFLEKIHVALFVII